MKGLNINPANTITVNDIKTVAESYKESAKVHHPAAGPINLTTIHKITNPPIPNQLALILNLIRLSL